MKKLFSILLIIVSPFAMQAQSLNGVQEFSGNRFGGRYYSKIDWQVNYSIFIKDGAYYIKLSKPATSVSSSSLYGDSRKFYTKQELGLSSWNFSPTTANFKLKFTMTYPDGSSHNSGADTREDRYIESTSKFKNASAGSFSIVSVQSMSYNDYSDDNLERIIEKKGNSNTNSTQAANKKAQNTNTPETKTATKQAGAQLNNKAKTDNSNAANPGGNSQNLQQTEDVLNAILKQLETDPTNPLNIDTKFLSDFSALLPEGSLKNTLQSYGSNLGTDVDLSYRQVYWDVASGFKQNPTLAIQTEFSKTMTGLSLLLDNSEVITNSFKNNVQNYKLGVFMSDENFIASISNITGSYESAQAAAMGIDLLVGIFKQIEENQKFKEDYKKLAKLSFDLAYAEKDVRLSKGLIDAVIGIEQHQMITPIYRYDFDNGATLRVENGILKYINAAKSKSIDLTKAEKKHDGNYYSRDTKAFDAGAHAFVTAISIAPNDSLFYLYTGANAFQNTKKCNCLDKKSGFLINALNGDITAKASKFNTPQISEVRNMYFSQDSMIVNSLRNNDWTTEYIWVSESNKLRNVSTVGYSLDKEKKFLINGSSVKFGRGLTITSNKSQYNFGKNNLGISLFWGEDSDETGGMVNVKVTPRHHSSVLQIGAILKRYFDLDGRLTNNNGLLKYEGQDGMTNELTGLTMNNNKDLFFTGKNGTIGKLSAAEYELDDQALPSKIRKAMSKKILAPYDFNAEKTFVSKHGELSNTGSSIFPSLVLTPDEKSLVYIVNDNLYIINPGDLNDVKSFKLNFEPNNNFFGKENGDITLYLQGQNDYKFPITKKYSISKLLTATDASDKLITKEKSKNNNSNLFVADEIKKLKELLDSGAITKEEFDAAKKQLLNK